MINGTWRTVLVVIGLIGAYAANYLGNDTAVIACAVIAIAFLLSGAYIWTRLKNRHWAFMLWSLLAPIGLLGISLLKDKSNKDDCNERI